MKKFIACSLLLILALSLAPSTVNAATFLVTTENDGDDGICNADCSLREAIQATNALAGSDFIVIPPGFYTLEIAGRGEQDNATGDLDIRDTLEIVGGGAGSCANRRERVVIDAESLGDRIFHILPSAGFVSMGCLTLQNGSLSELPSGVEDMGGAIRNQSGLFLSNVIVQESRARSGGGIFNDDGELELRNVLVRNNVASANGEGGGILIGNSSNARSSVIIQNSTIEQNSAFNGGGIAAYASLTLDEAIISGNTASGPAGGLFIYNDDGDESRIRGGTIEANQAEGGFGGGIRNFRGNLFLENVTLAENEAVQGGGIDNLRLGTLLIERGLLTENFAMQNGGGISNRGSLTILDSILQSNFSGQSGGGFYNNGGSVVIEASTLQFNRSRFGGGFFVESAAQLTDIVNVTLFGNEASQNGGGVAVNGGNTTFGHATIFGNTADALFSLEPGGEGGGIHVARGVVALENSIVAGNHISALVPTPATRTTDCFGELAMARGNVFGVRGDGMDFDCTFLADEGGNLSGTLDEPLTPIAFGTLTADHGGPTQTVALSPESEAIGLALEDRCAETDQRGEERNTEQCEGCDAGAYQVCCGDGDPAGNEECDNGMENSDTLPNRCRLDCQAAGCGDGVLDDGEACDGEADCLEDCSGFEAADDGNTDDDDGDDEGTTGDGNGDQGDTREDNTGDDNPVDETIEDLSENDGTSDGTTDGTVENEGPNGGSTDDGETAPGVNESEPVSGSGGGCSCNLTPHSSAAKNPSPLLFSLLFAGLLLLRQWKLKYSYKVYY